MLKALLLIVVAAVAVFFLLAIIQGIKNAQSMTPEEAQNIIKEEQQRKEQQRKEEERIAQVKLDRYLNRLKNKLNESEYHNEDEEDEDEDDEYNIDDILYGDLDKAIDDYNKYGIGPDPDEKHTFGGYINPELHKRKEEREFNEWLKQQK